MKQNPTISKVNRWIIPALFSLLALLSSCETNNPKCEIVWLDTTNRVHISNEIVYKLHFSDAAAFNLNFFRFVNGNVFFGNTRDTQVSGDICLSQSYDFYLFNSTDKHVDKLFSIADTASLWDYSTQPHDDIPNLYCLISGGSRIIPYPYMERLQAKFFDLALYSQQLRLPFEFFDINRNGYIYHFYESNIVMMGDFAGDQECITSGREIITSLKYADNGQFCVVCSMNWKKSELPNDNDQEFLIQIFQDDFQETARFTFPNCCDARISNNGKELILLCGNNREYFDFYHYTINGDIKYIGKGKDAFFIE